MDSPRFDLLIILVLGSQLAHAQTLWHAPLPPVPLPGLYAVSLSPEILGNSAPDLRNLRLFDASGAEIPFVLAPSTDQRPAGAFVSFPLVRNEVQDQRTLIELERPADRVLDMLHIRVRPVDVQKHVRILGSDDREQWFLVKEDHMVAQGARGDPPHQFLSIDIPRTDYRWLRLLLNDSLTAPMQVLGVGYFNTEEPPTRYVSSSPLEWTQKDTAQETRIRIRADRPIRVDRFRFVVVDTGQFLRSGQLRSWRTETYGKGARLRRSKAQRRVASFVIASDLAPIVDLPSSVLDTFDLVIDNGNDRPLRFSTLEAFAHQHLILARLSPGTTYQVVIGDPGLAQPLYDMAHFSETLPPPLDTLTTGTLVPFINKPSPSPWFDPSTWWVWGVILILMVGMGAMAFRMMRKID